MAMVVAAQTCAAFGWFGRTYAAIYLAVAPVLIPFVLGFASVRVIKQWLKIAVIISAVSMAFILAIATDLPPYYGLAVWTSVIIWFYWGYREFRALYSPRYRQRNLHGRRVEP